MFRQVIFGSVMFAASAMAFGAHATPYYLHSGAADAVASDAAAMDQVFGSGSWTDQDYVTADASLFDDAEFVFMQGTGDNAAALETFLGNADNKLALEDYVFAGGTVFIEAPLAVVNELNFGFGTQVVYDDSCDPSCFQTSLGDLFSESGHRTSLSAGYLENESTTPGDHIGDMLLGLMRMGKGFALLAQSETIQDVTDPQQQQDPSDPTRVPEPATLALFGVGLAAMGASRLRRKRA